MRTSLILSILLLIGLVGCANRTKTHIPKIENTPVLVEDIPITIEILPTVIEFVHPQTNQETISFSFNKLTSWEVQLRNQQKEIHGFYTIAHGTGLDGEVQYGLWMKEGQDYDIRVVTDDGKIIHQMTGVKHIILPTIILP